MKYYRQLTRGERYQIQALLGAGISQMKIAVQLGKHKSTISRELHRNTELPHWSHRPGYSARKAQGFTRQRRLDKSFLCRKIRGELKTLVENKLRLSWSPEQISGRLRLESGIRISHETIYQHVLRDSSKSGMLRYCLRFAGYKQHRFKKSKYAERNRLRRKSIEHRPAAANKRSEIGHWERDLIEGTKGAACLLTIVDRRSRFTCVKWIDRRCTDDVGEQTISALHPHRKVNRSLTNDNGLEFKRAQALEAALGIGIYYTAPSSPWERGTVENTNGLIRQYFRKHTPLERYSRWMPLALEETLNYRPRKTLKYRTPFEVFYKEKVSLMSGALLRLGLEFSCLT